MITTRRGWIGIDIGARAVKIAQLERADHGLRLRDGLVIQRLLPWTAEESELHDFSSIDELRAGLSLGSFRGSLAACAASMRLCQCRIVEIPDGSGRDRRDWIIGEFQKEPAVGQQPEFDFWETEQPNTDGDEQAERAAAVGVISMDRQHALRIARDASRLRLHCRILDGLPLALARAVSLSGGAQTQQVVAALDLGYSSATLCVCRQGRAVYVRCLRRCGLEDPLQVLCRTLDISSEEAHLVLSRHGLPPASGPSSSDPPLEVMVSEAIQEHLQRLIDELQRTLAYLRAHRTALVPSRLLLLGGGATIRNLPQLLAQKTGIAADVWRPAGVALAGAASASCPVELLGPAIALSALAWDVS